MQKSIILYTAGGKSNCGDEFSFSVYDPLQQKDAN